MSENAAKTAFSEDAPSFRETEVDGGFIRLSKLAVAALVVALFSCFALLTASLLWANVLAVLLGAAALMRIYRDGSLGGARFAQVAIVLGALAGFWAMTASQLHARYLYQVAGLHAKKYLETLARGDTFQAMELRKAEAERQLAGTQLALVYGGGESEAAKEMQRFLESQATKLILKSGPQSNWELYRGTSIEWKNQAQFVTVRMRDMAHDNMPDVAVELARVTGAIRTEGGELTALWHVVGESVVEGL